MARTIGCWLCVVAVASGLAAPRNFVRSKASFRGSPKGLVAPLIAPPPPPPDAVTLPTVVDAAADAAADAALATLRAGSAVEVVDAFVGRNRARLSVDGEAVDVDTTRLCQREDEAAWLRVRAALDLTASEFDAARDRHRFASRDDVLARKAELASAPRPFRGNEATRFGLKNEPRAIADYVRATGHVVEATGLWTLGAYGASPDGLVFDGESHGLLEVKTSFAKRKKSHHGPFTKCPRRFFAQIQGQLAVVDREWQRGTTGVVFCLNRAWNSPTLILSFLVGEWCDLVSWIPRNSHRPNFAVVRVYRDRAFWDAELRPALEAFSRDLAALRAAQAPSEPS